jgi:hypothetical protein
MPRRLHSRGSAPSDETSRPAARVGRSTTRTEEEMKIDTTRLTRREFVNWTAGAIGLTMTGGLVGCARDPSPAARQSRVPVGVQLYSVRHEFP